MDTLLTQADVILSNLWIVIIVLIFVIIVAVPVMQRRAINTARRRLLTMIGQARKTEVITLIHRMETVTLIGIPIARYIDIDDSEEVLRAIRSTPPDVPIDLILHTPGGLALATTQIALALRAHPHKKTVIIPHYAMSGGTLIALAADEIIMDPHAAMGPVDPQLVDQTGIYPAFSLLKVLEKKDINKIDDRTLVLADEARKAIDQTNILIRKILGDRYSPETIDVVLQELATGKYPHDHPLMAEDVMRLFGDRVTTRVPGEVYDLMKLYRMEISGSRPGVEYVPVAPRR